MVTERKAATNKAWRLANPDKVAAHGLVYRMKHREEAAERSRAWRLANPEREVELHRAWYSVNREKNNEASRAWRLANPERAAELNRTWHLANPGRGAELDRAWRLANPERKAATMRAWYLANPERVAANNRRRRARKRGLTVVRLSADTCQTPGCPNPVLHPDKVYPHPLATTAGHEPPISRCVELGITEVVERPEHWGCNARKGTRLDSEM